MQTEYFIKSFVNPAYKFNTLYSKANVIKNIDVTKFKKVETVKLETKYNVINRKKCDIRFEDNLEIDQHIAESRKELSELYPDFEIFYKVKSVLLPMNVTDIDTIAFKAVARYETKQIWVDLLLSKQQVIIPDDDEDSFSF